MNNLILSKFFILFDLLQERKGSMSQAKDVTLFTFNMVLHIVLGSSGAFDVEASCAALVRALNACPFAFLLAYYAAHFGSLFKLLA